MTDEQESVDGGPPLETLRYDVIDLFVRAAHCERWEDQPEIAAAFVGALDRYIDARLSARADAPD